MSDNPLRDSLSDDEIARRRKLHEEAEQDARDLRDEEAQALLDLAKQQAIEAGTDRPAAQPDGEGEGQAAEPEQPRQRQMDILELATIVLVGANNRLGESKTPPTVERQLQLGHALATLALARATDAQFQLNAQIVARAQQAQQQQAERAKGPAGIVVPNLVPNRG